MSNHTPTPNHTPAPWTIQSDNGGDGCYYIVAEQGKQWNNPTICRLYDDVTPEDSVTIGAWLKPQDNAEANAHLIAAAPDLLEALGFYMSQFGQALQAYGIPFGPQQLAAHTQARAAIAKAFGLPAE